MANVMWIDGPGWPRVNVRFTTRVGGVSAAPFDHLNLGTHVGDRLDHVLENRRRVSEGLPSHPRWLEQVHGTRVWTDEDEAVHSVQSALSTQSAQSAQSAQSTQSNHLSQSAQSVGSAHDVPVPRADAATTSIEGRVLAVMVADCLPVLIANEAGTAIGVAHAGWRGLADGVLERTLQTLQASHPQEHDWRAWIGPAIGPATFEVGQDVRDVFLAQDVGAAACFTAREGLAGKWLADLPALAARRLARAGLMAVQQSGRCTYTESDLFFSYRRDGACGRMALLAWIG